MTKRWLGILLPAGLALAGIMTLIRVSLIDQPGLLPQDLDLLLILFGLSIATFASITLIVREALEQLIERARIEAFAEHRRFLNRLDHELKNPLTTIRVGLGGLGITALSDSQRQLIATMEAEALRLSRLVGDLRKLAELETLPLETQMIDLKALLTEVEMLNRERIEADGKRLIVALSRTANPSQVQIPGDYDLLLLALHNLLDNAFKYTRTGDTIFLSAGLTQDQGVIIRVQDTGIGIPADEIPLVWEELYRGDKTRSIPGSGIGLALVKAIVERHDGDTALHSVYGQGTTVTLLLPHA